jgi:hypothetical protein
MTTQQRARDAARRQKRAAILARIARSRDYLRAQIAGERHHGGAQVTIASALDDIERWEEQLRRHDLGAAA